MIIQNKEILKKSVSELKERMNNDLKGINQEILPYNLRNRLLNAQKDLQKHLMHMDSLCKDDMMFIDQNFYKEKLDNAYKDFLLVVQQAVVFVHAKGKSMN